MPQKHRMMFGVPVIIEENSSSNQIDNSEYDNEKPPIKKVKESSYSI